MAPAQGWRRKWPEDRCRGNREWQLVGMGGRTIIV